MGAVEVRTKLAEQVRSPHVRGHTASRVRRIAARLVPVAAAAVAAYASLLVFEILTTGFSGRPLDISIYYAAAAALRANPHANIYDPTVLASAASAHPGCKLWPGVTYPYPPLLAILMQPLAALPFDAAVRVWMLFNLALWAVDTALLVYWLRVLLSGGMTRSAADGRSWRRRLSMVLRGEADGPTVAALGVVAVSVLAWPVLQGLLMGQVNVLLLFLLLCVPICVRRNWPVLAGALLALAIMIKLLPLVLLAYYLARGRWRLALVAVAASVLLLGAMALVVGVPTLLDARAILGGGYDVANIAYNVSLAQAPTWLAAAFGGRAATLASVLGNSLIALAGILVAGGLVVVWRMCRAAGDPARYHSGRGAEVTELLGYGWAICAMLLLSPLVWLHYYTWLLLPFVLCVGYVLGERRRTNTLKRHVAHTTLVLLLVAGALLFLPWSLRIDATAYATGPYLAGVGLRPLLMVLQPAGVVLLWGIAGRLVWRSRTYEAEPAMQFGHPASKQAPSEIVSESVWHIE